jgi:thiosulfate reductase cytochrome b subunit
MSNSFCSFSLLWGRGRRAVASVAYLLGLAVVLGLVVLGGLLCGSRDDTFTLLELLGLLGGHFGEFWRR